MVELWKALPISAYDGLYEVSDAGGVRRVRTQHGRIKSVRLKASADKAGYVFVSLCANGRPRTFKVHRLIALAFVDGDKTLDINHKNGNKADNRPCNLEWVSKAQNNRHARDWHLWHPNIGPNHPRGNRKVNEQQVLLIRELCKSRKYREIAKQFGVTESAISNIANRVTWVHL